MPEIKLLDYHEGKHDCCQLLVLRGKQAFIVLADEEQGGKNKLVINAEVIFDQDKH